MFRERRLKGEKHMKKFDRTRLTDKASETLASTDFQFKWNKGQWRSDQAGSFDSYEEISEFLEWLAKEEETYESDI